MPTYVNRHAGVIVVRNTHFPFQQEVEVDFLIDLNEYKTLEKISDNPKWSPLIANHTLTNPGDLVNLTDWKNCSTLVIYSETLDKFSKFTFNDPTKPQVCCTPNNPFSIQPRHRIKSVHLISGGPIFIEEWKGENFLI